MAPLTNPYKDTGFNIDLNLKIKLRKIAVEFI
jgi:hypothetical protein